MKIDKNGRKNKKKNKKKKKERKKTEIKQWKTTGNKVKNLKNYGSKKQKYWIDQEFCLFQKM